MKKFRGIANAEYIAGMREIRKSNAAGVHADKRTKRARTRADSFRRAVRESLS
jgi:hypothetical protein